MFARSTFKHLSQLAVGLVAIIACSVFVGLLGTFVPLPLTSNSATGELLDQTILVVSNTIHTDIAIPAETKTLEKLSFLKGTGLPLGHPDAQWLLVGWGGRSFYLETPTLADIKPAPLFRALTVDSSVMHIDVVGALPENHPDITKVKLTQSGYENLLHAISKSFVQNAGAVVPIAGAAFGPTDRFYEAHGHFNVLLGCNTWTARMLRAAGIRTGLWNPVPPSLTHSIRIFNDS